MKQMIRRKCFRQEYSTCGSPEAGERLERTKNVPQFTPLAPSQRASMAKGCSKQAKWHKLSEEGEAETIGAFRAH